ncbi:transcriptional regulator [Streptococcus agalactiae]|uniref:helix-turn-helix domain-containing protein n=1 Tax=Streptococcus agalactiae TaxID=1311 RepID=UPI001375336E|nr:helix-turn-helix domain-containing protein [Streptococcus agalactiae]KAF1128145.1 transcriptional regulator [Streptococcus agalactiae]MCD0020567.1 transcriptional regulator [Streptococcus agalactiae]HEN9895401.1 transcriptional regulator [Streptococcus agalactiae]
MIITNDIAQKVIIKRSINKMTKTDLASKLNISTHTLLKIENGNYKAPRRIYQSVMSWLVEDL